MAVQVDEGACADVEAALRIDGSGVGIEGVVAAWVRPPDAASEVGVDGSIRMHEGHPLVQESTELREVTRDDEAVIREMFDIEAGPIGEWGVEVAF